ncbi:multicopper oxidase type 3 [Methylobacterium sp. 4-46]|uniref:multicopper oxidase family protein n=1 Tax=unclassified Methylobacterium TaxID=2615210 RepID=UPI000165CB3B|nr:MULTISPECIES: multicopper oxidase family protein [Methylobacterium]ACA20837.1 multicopper oxidase type 3 [Methylobacterium sp. 4-46]WFT79992.1 multicopper oxidase family protein [Methylobacterium nodulans]
MTPSSPPTRRALLAGAALALVPARPRAQAPQPAGPGAAPGGPAPAPEPRILTAAPATARLRPDAPAETPVWAFDGRSVPPVLRVKRGEAVRLRLDNRTDKPLSLHWHGVRNANAMDGVGGVTQAPVAPGASFLYAFTPPDAGTALIRPLVVGGASEPAGRGLAGLLVVEEAKPPVVDRDVPLVLQDWRLEPDGTLAGFGPLPFAASSGRLGNTLTVNGRPGPEAIAAPPGARLRLRLANACNARATRLRFDKLKVWVAAVDGQPTDTFEPLRATLPFPPGTRYDVLLDVPSGKEGGGTVTALIGPGIPLAVVTPEGEALPARPPVAAIGENPLLPPEIKLQNAVRRDLTLAGGATLDKARPEAPPAYAGDPARIWTVNGAAGTAGAAPLFSVKRGSVVVLALTNQTAFPQSLHLHGHVFRLLHPLDDGWEPYWLDTFQLLEGRTARIAFLADNPGRWLVSATALERFDTGLWTSFEVT